MKRKLLAVCSDDDFLGRVEEELRESYIVIQTGDLEEALEVAGEEAVDCIVCHHDVTDGPRCVSELDECYPNTPVIAAGTGSDVMEHLEAGADDYFLVEQPVEALKRRVDVYARGWFESKVLESLIENIPAGVLVVDEDRRVTLVNQRFVEIWGLGELADDVVGADDVEIMDEAAEKVVEPEDWVETTERIIREFTDVTHTELVLEDGSVLDRIYVPVETGGVQRDLWVFRDVTRYRERERQLRGLHQATRRLIEADSMEEVYDAVVEATEEVLEYDTVGLYTPKEDGDALEPAKFNEAANELFGEVPELPMESFFGESYRSGELLVEDDVREHELVHDPDTPLRSEVAVPLGSHGVLGSGSREVAAYRDRDLDFLEILAANARSALDRLEHEREVEEREEWYSALIETSNDIITVLAPDGTIRYQSPSVERIMGYAPEEMEGDNTFDYVHPDDRERVLQEFMEGMQEPGIHDTKVEYRYRASDGSYRWMESIGSSRLGDPVVEGGVVNSRDITERKEKERELQRQKERLEEFAGVVSHDLRNPLSVLSGRLELALDTGDIEHVESARDAADRMEALVDSLLELARAGAVVSDAEEVDVEKMARTAWVNVPTDDVEMSMDCGVTVEADVDRLVQLFENLYRNAVEHAGDGEGEEGLTTVYVGGLEGGRGFYVEDDGVGLSESALERAFEHGYTEGEGSGLGLAIVEEIAEAHGWTVEAREKGVHGGARFEFHVDESPK